MNKKEKNYITPAGYQKLCDEHEFLTRKERPEMTKVVAWAASLGDRSENADYIYGKKRLREIDRRLRFLSKRIEAAFVVDPESITSKKIQFGATVDLLDGNEKKLTYSIVGTDETISDLGYISFKSPIGRSLIGKEVGDIIVVHAPKGEIEFEVLKVAYKKLETGVIK